MEDWEKEIRKKIKVGEAVWKYYGKGHRANSKYNIRAIIEDEEPYVVFRQWSYRKKYWIYEAWMLYEFYLLDEAGRLKENTKGV